MRVLVACEESGTVRDAFLDAGHDAISCDLQPARSRPERHMQGDVMPALDWGWDLVIAHPPCTRLTNSGVRWLAERDLWNDMEAGAAFFNAFKGCAPRVCIENPIMHKYARDLCGQWTQTVQPWQFGDEAFKRTALWLEGLPPLVPTNVLTPPKAGTDEHKRWSKVHRCPPGADRAKIRSTFFPGIARAMAYQWGQL